jgi:hypothetical protein
MLGKARVFSGDRFSSGVRVLFEETLKRHSASGTSPLAAK